MSELALNPGETLGEYVRRLRHAKGLTQEELSHQAGIHRQTLNKIEGNHTQRLTRKAKQGLAIALGIPTDYLNPTMQGQQPDSVHLKFCPHCWTPGSPPDPIWGDRRSQFCFRCGTALRDRCTACQEPILSLRFRFCPYCGVSYKTLSETRST
jgi:DNA-binding XRE family transcriptional regulator